MIPRWLFGYSLGDLMQIAAGGMIYLGSGLALLHSWEDKNRPPLSATVAGFLWGVCWMVSPVLHTKPQWVGLSHILTMAGSAFAFLWLVLLNRHSKTKRAAVLSQPQYAPATDDIWPPPPTAPRGGQP